MASLFPWKAGLRWSVAILMLGALSSCGGFEARRLEAEKSPRSTRNPKFSNIEYFRESLRASKAAMDLPEEPSLLPEWRENVARRLSEALGLHNSKPVPLEPRVLSLEARDGYRIERIVYSSEAFADVPGILLIPDGVSAENPAPAVLCLHGNVPGAKEELAGETADPRAMEGLQLYRDDYARDLARQGFVTLAIDLRDSGEREHYEPYEGPPALTRVDDLSGESWRQISGLMAIPLGKTYLGLSVFDAIRALDYLETRPEVLKDSLGGVGFSAGATLTAWLAAIDRRIKVAGISGTSVGRRQGLVESLHRRRPAGLIPGFLVDLDADLCIAVIAPTPLVFARDRRERRGNAEAGVERIRRAYDGLGAAENLKIQMASETGHVWHREIVVPWFVERLRATIPEH